MASADLYLYLKLQSFFKLGTERIEQMDGGCLGRCSSHPRQRSNR